MEKSDKTPEEDSPSVSGSSTPTSLHDFQKNVNKRLNTMTDRQDSIQALSLWMIHHKSQCQKIASCWLAAMKRAKAQRRLLLFYLANDIVQNCKKKNAKIFLLAFKNVLKDAVVLVRDSSISNKIERIFQIWEERNTYFIDFVNELRELLNDREKVTAHVSAANFKPEDVSELISKVKLLETHVAMKQKQVANLKLDASKIEAVKQLKDRSHSHDFAKQFDDSYNKMQGYVKLLENEIEQRSKLTELLENGQTFYEVQNDDAMVVANAYRNFGIRINNLKKRLGDYKNTLPGDSPIPSPTAEAPSPGNTPPPSTADADDAMDMDVSDTEDNEDSGVIIAAEPYSLSNVASTSSEPYAAVTPGVADPRSQQQDQSAANPYSPSEHLDREKTSNTKAISYLSNLISTKAAQPSASDRGKSVLKHLTDFAEKVKNPPPASWSDYKRKQQEKFETSMTTNSPDVCQQLQKSVESDNNIGGDVKQQQELTGTLGHASPDEQKLSSTGWPPQVEGSVSTNTYLDEKVTAGSTNTRSLQPHASYSSTQQATPVTPTQQAAPITPTQQTTRVPPYKNLTAPPLPPNLSMIGLKTPSLTSPVSPPVHPPAHLVPPTSMKRILSTEEQQDALCLLDRIHSSSNANVGTDNMAVAAESPHMYGSPQNLVKPEMSREPVSMPPNHGQPIMTLSDRRAFPPTSMSSARGGFNNRSPARYQQPTFHGYNDPQTFNYRKRPYQEYNPGYQGYGNRYY